MPTLAVERDVLFDHIGRVYSDEEFDELCFEFGVELDDITSERDEATKSATVKLTKTEMESLSNAVIYKIDVPANRYDLLCVEGLSRALRVFQGEMNSPTYTLSTVNETDSSNRMTVLQANTSTIRPFIVCAILRNITFTPQRYKSFLDLQDQLHRNLCRNRTLVAIGTHDLDTVQGPFTYDARSPQSIRFIPLTHDGEPDAGTDSQMVDAYSLLQLYATNPSYKHLKPFVPIIADSPLYPVVLDSNGVVMSLPPIINGSHSKITLDTKNVFIECTATDLTKANVVLDTMVCMFSEYTEPHPFVVEPVHVTYVVHEEDNASSIVQQYTTPILQMRKEKALVPFVNSLIGIDISAEQMVNLCEKLQLGPAQLLEDKDGTTAVLEVTVPPTRSDILHAVDIAEDIGIAYGYNNIVKRTPATCTVGREQPLNQLGDLLREEVSYYIE
jgi:phenylalanyl-tRNA synthetase beta chain